MGRIRTKLVKRNSKEIIEKYPDLFTSDFDNNKKSIDKVAEIRSKKLKNLILGYISKLKKISSAKN